MSKNKKLSKGEESFNRFFTDFYEDRWERISDSLNHPEKQIIRHCYQSKAGNMDWLPHASWFHKGDDAELVKQGRHINYIMSPASYFVALQLPLKEDFVVLDMCAAPGGKSLVILEGLKRGKLVLNEISRNRREKLKSVIRKYRVEDDVDVELKGLDGLKYGLQYPNFFDAIILDAPCSGERHLVEKPSELAKWSPKRTKRLAGIQYGLLCSAILALKPGGDLIYSTCSLSPLENENNIQKLLNKKSDQVQLVKEVSLSADIIEETEFGYYFLPDHSGIGPMFFSHLRKR